MDEISKNSKKPFLTPEEKNWTISDTENFRKNLTRVNQKFSTKSLTNPNPAKSLKKVETLKPSYIENFGDYNKTGTLLNNIFKEFDSKIVNSISLVDLARKYSREIDSYSKQIKDALEIVVEKLTPLDTAFDNIKKDVMVPWSDIVIFSFNLF